MLVDSHCHLNYLDDPEAQITLAREADVGAILCISVEEATMPAVYALAAGHRNVWATAGQHPERADAPLDWIVPWLRKPEVIAVGETGLDYYHAAKSSERALQRNSFARQLQMAQEHGLPVIVHTRDAVADTLAMLAERPEVIGVLHCFTESAEMAEAAMELGYFLSFSGIVTFRNAEPLRDVVAQLPLSRILIETDAPWLAPAPHRGKPNAPALLPHTAAVVAELQDLEVAELAAATRRNFETLFQVRVTSA